MPTRESVVGSRLSVDRRFDAQRYAVTVGEHDRLAVGRRGDPEHPVLLAAVNAVPSGVSTSQRRSPRRPHGSTSASSTDTAPSDLTGKMRIDSTTIAAVLN